MGASKSYEWGSCPCSGGAYGDHTVEVRMTVDGKPVLLSEVPQGRCPNCGARVYKAESIARIEAVMNNEVLDRRLNPAT